MTMKLSHHVSDDVLLKALALLTSPVFGALAMAHQLGGAPSEPWLVIGTFTYRQIADEIAERGLSLDGLKTSCSDVLVVDSPVTHWMFEYDPRPRCPLCCRPHFVSPRDGTERSCGRNQRTYYPPEWRWTRATAQAAVEGTYRPAARPEARPSPGGEVVKAQKPV